MNILNNIFIAIIKTYQLIITPFLPKSCRFYPTCSNYALEAFKKYRLHQAVYLSIKRILKCHPFNPGGYDPLPHIKE
ncbi:MAG: membrane protein insertion efficiency factor YidD [Candidatus Marinimicrobia bacterium]|nr:membrane protein insertion efficiency factor YidD [Candidatus Neomarinimicrobiota bacterium]